MPLKKVTDHQQVLRLSAVVPLSGKLWHTGSGAGARFCGIVRQRAASTAPAVAFLRGLDIQRMPGAGGPVRARIAAGGAAAVARGVACHGYGERLSAACPARCCAFSRSLQGCCWAPRDTIGLPLLHLGGLLCALSPYSVQQLLCTHT